MMKQRILSQLPLKKEDIKIIYNEKINIILLIIIDCPATRALPVFGFSA
jgi:hypothetical protein